MAVDAAWQGQGLGLALLRHAVQRSLRAASIIGVRGLLVHAISVDAKAFYERYGFVETAADSWKLILSLKLTDPSGSGISPVPSP
jgi:GNAT superfamily N-acetyltransferase